MFDDPELIGDFVVESNEHLAHVESQLLQIEANGADIDVDLVNTVFRAVHSIKGTAGFLGLQTINRLAHSLENVLNAIRGCELAPTSSIVDTMLRAADQLRTLINDVPGSSNVDVSELQSALDRILESSDDPSPVGEPNTSNGDFHQEVGDRACDGAMTTSTIEDRRPGEESQRVMPDEASPHPAAAASDPSAMNSGSVMPPAAQQDANIRVSVSVLDRLMNLAGELVLSRNQLLQAVSSPEAKNLDAITAGLDQVTSELQEAIMQTRMQQIGIVFNRFPRVVRDLSASLGKDCRLEIDGKDVEVDKGIIEAIADPLTHLIRNSVDHGIESPQARTAAGKAANGTIQLRAHHMAGKVCIDIRDDGAGIDPVKLKEKAVAKGVITSEAAEYMGDREAIRLIFHPGFSTALKVTDVSGRGVGMDVVRTNIEKLGGSVDVESEVGVGTLVRVTLPLTLAIIPSLIVHAASERYAVPQANIRELVRVRREEFHSRIGRVKDADVLRLRGDLLPLVYLSRVLSAGSTIAKQPLDGDSAAETRLAEATNIIVVEAGATRCGLVVDGLHDSEEIVVKPLGRHLKGCRCLSGATILGDGHVSLILDAAGIVAQAKLKTIEGKDTAADEAQEVRQGGEKHSLLLFSNNPNEHFAIPMSLVVRIERFASNRLETVGDQKVIQYSRGLLPLLSLDELIQVRAAPELERFFAIVFDVNGHEFGLIAPELRDIRDVDIALDRTTLREPGVMGSLIVDGDTTRLINVFELAEASHAEWFEREEVDLSDGAPVILLAEDSTFFRNQVASFLEDRGYEVIACEDGQIAWNKLLSESEVDLVITDIEMPNMNGLELSRKIKSNPALKHLPIIALTSLASNEDIHRGRECGIDDYQVKMDREKLTASVSRMLPVDSKSRARRPIQELEEVGS
ncbi:MAG: hybrid sensor histidine kinase/response regulator [Pirellulaceae bacterium]